MSWTAEITVGLIVNIVGLALTGSPILYRIKVLEKKVEKHNCFMERSVVIENTIRGQQHQINDLKSERNK